jgi:anti-sigma regulatory factor (Ser/Thr protein kinase)
MTGEHLDTLEITPDPAELARMREFIRHNASRCGLEENERFRAQLVATEAVTNAIRHGTQPEGGRSPIAVTCRSDDDGLVIEVGDRGRFRHRKPSRAEDTSGRGLGMIERFTSRFDLETSEDGTRLRMLVEAA